jgi:hypothetical protein
VLSWKALSLGWLAGLSSRLSLLYRAGLPQSPLASIPSQRYLSEKLSQRNNYSQIYSNVIERRIRHFIFRYGYLLNCQIHPLKTVSSVRNDVTAIRDQRWINQATLKTDRQHKTTTKKAPTDNEQQQINNSKKQCQQQQP